MSSIAVIKNSPLTIFPFVVSGNGRYLVDTQGAPVLLSVAAGTWSAIQGISYANFVDLANTQKARGFNAMHLSLISRDILRLPTTTGQHFAAPNWNNGSAVAPFTTANNFSTSNSTYFAHARACIDYLASINMLAILQTAYLGWNGDTGPGDEGWAYQMVADTDAHMTTYGTYVGTLFNDAQNVIYGLGGDYIPVVSSTLESRIKSIRNAIVAVDPDKLWAGHMRGWTYEQATFAAYPEMLWCHYSSFESDDVLRYAEVREARAVSPTRPAVMLDEAYEEDIFFFSDATDLRYNTHSSMCEGAAGISYARGGNSPEGWAFMEDWDSVRPGLTEHSYATAFWVSQPWATMAPDTSNTFVTAGRGTFNTFSYVTVLASSSRLIAFFPSGGGHTITVSMSQFSAAKRARWYDPTANTYTLISASLANTGTQNFSNPGTNANGGGDSDWLLVLD